MQPALPELRRRSVLAMLGVPLLTARQALPGAAPSRPEPVAPAVASARPRVAAVETASAAPVTPVRSVARPPLPELSAFKAMPVSVPEPVAVPAATPAVVAEPAVVTSFSCRLFQVTATLAVLIDLGEYPDLTPSARQLWQSICLAFGWQAATLGADFTWPLLPRAGTRSLLDAGPDAARAVLKGRLERDLVPGMRLLVLGAGVAAHVEQPHRLLPALDELLASPLAKRALWQQLAADAVA